MKEKHPNQFSRLSTLIGEDKLDILKEKKVLVVGVGGVGGYVVESLARSGIGNITIVDYDVVDITNINRQIIALTSTIGCKKVELFKKRIKDINPNCKVEIFDIFLNEENYLNLIRSDYDYIIDCCDDIKAKKILLREANNRNISFISSMGTANKIDPSKLEIVDLRKTVNDPLARIMRKFLKEERINKKIMVLSSTELPIKNSKLGSNAFVPATAGLLISSYVVEKLYSEFTK